MFDSRSIKEAILETGKSVGVESQSPITLEQLADVLAPALAKALLSKDFARELIKLDDARKQKLVRGMGG